VRPELSWSHYRLLIRIEEEKVRQFYVQESIAQHWSTRKLDRNISSQYFQRILTNQSSKELPTGVEKHTQLDYIKNPYVLEFLNLPANLS
jgi:predicted nuclease of restriction endonuclease-like (RecB) superfamily